MSGNDTSTDLNPFETQSPFTEVANHLSSSQLSYTNAINIDRPIDSFQGQASCVELIKKLLTKDPRKRIKIQDIKNQEWFLFNKDKVNHNIRKKGEIY